MLKLMKYEFRKMRTTLAVMGLALLALELGFIIGERTDNARITGLCLGLVTVLVFVVYTYILIAGIVSYSRELNDKSGYLTFMAPVTPAGVVASKLLYTIITALAVTALFGAAAWLDYRILFKRFGVDDRFFRQLDMTFRMFVGGENATLTEALLNVAFEAGAVVIQVLTVMCCAYLALTLSATLLQNRRGFVRALVSFLFFAALQTLTGRVSGWVTGEASIDSFESMRRMLLLDGAVNGAFCLAFAALSAGLLDRKVSL